MEPMLWGKRHEEGRGRDGERSRYHMKEGTRKLRRVDADEMQRGVQWVGQEGKRSLTGCIRRGRKERGGKLDKERPGVRGGAERGQRG